MMALRYLTATIAIFCRVGLYRPYRMQYAIVSRVNIWKGALAVYTRFCGIGRHDDLLRVLHWKVRLLVHWNYLYMRIHKWTCMFALSSICYNGFGFPILQQFFDIVIHCFRILVRLILSLREALFILAASVRSIDLANYDPCVIQALPCHIWFVSDQVRGIVGGEVLIILGVLQGVRVVQSLLYFKLLVTGGLRRRF